MRILVIEDDIKIARLIKKGLEQQSYAVDLAHDGEIGLDLALGESYDLIILDIMLPTMDGISLCKILRLKQNHVPILMLTARGELEDRIDGLDTGADDYLTKPFAFQELFARVRALIRRPIQIVPNILKKGSITLDTTNHLLIRDMHPIYVSKKEFSLLEYMMRNEGTILSKESIVEHVWSFDADILPNTVEVYIGYLRNKLEKPFPKKPKLIHTVRGFGYRFYEET